MSLYGDDITGSDTSAFETVEAAIEELGLRMAPGAIAGMLLGRYGALLGSPDVWRHVDVPGPRPSVVDVRQAQSCPPPVAELADRGN